MRSTGRTADREHRRLDAGLDPRIPRASRMRPRCRVPGRCWAPRSLHSESPTSPSHCRPVPAKPMERHRRNSRRAPSPRARDTTGRNGSIHLIPNVRSRDDPGGNIARLPTTRSPRRRCGTRQRDSRSAQTSDEDLASRNTSTGPKLCDRISVIRFWWAVDYGRPRIRADLDPRAEHRSPSRRAGSRQRRKSIHPKARKLDRLASTITGALQTMAPARRARDLAHEPERARSTPPDGQGDRRHCRRTAPAPRRHVGASSVTRGPHTH